MITNQSKSELAKCAAWDWLVGGAKRTQPLTTTTKPETTSGNEVASTEVDAQGRPVRSKTHGPKPKWRPVVLAKKKARDKNGC